MPGATPKFLAIARAYGRTGPRSTRTACADHLSANWWRGLLWGVVLTLLTYLMMSMISADAGPLA